MKVGPHVKREMAWLPNLVFVVLLAHGIVINIECAFGGNFLGVLSKVILIQEHHGRPSGLLIW